LLERISAMSAAAMRDIGRNVIDICRPLPRMKLLRRIK
jgi:hypothetical protein